MREDLKINDRALALEKSLIEKLELVFDTDVELDVYNLGLIYEIHLDEAGTCKVVMTFTDTACSCAESLPIEIVARLKEIEGIGFWSISSRIRLHICWHARSDIHSFWKRGCPIFCDPSIDQHGHC